MAAALLCLSPLSLYPHAGSNSLDAGGGGRCVYEYAAHQAVPVVTRANCSISRKDLDQGTEPGESAREYVRKLGGHDGCENDDAGHILANRLGGRGVPTNLFPQSPHLNRGAWEVMERGIADCLADHATSATLQWTFAYSAALDQRPRSATYAVEYDQGCPAVSQSFLNTCTGMETVNLNISCIDSTTASSGCIIHTQADSSFKTAHDDFVVPLAKQFEIIHLRQPTRTSTYSALTWCVSESSHLTPSGSFVFKLGVTNATRSGSLDCLSAGTFDLNPGECMVAHAREGASVQLCFDHREQ